MNKEQFLKSLDKALTKLPTAERNDILRDFEEHFIFGREEGKSDEQIANSLGTPKQIAKELLASYHLEQVQATATTGNIIRAVWAVIGLGFFNLVIVLGPFTALAAILFGGWTISAGFTLSPLLVLVNAIIYPSTFTLFDLFTSIALAGLGLLIGIGMFYTSRLFGQGFIRYLNFNVKLVKGGLKHD